MERPPGPPTDAKCMTIVQMLCNSSHNLLLRTAIHLHNISCVPLAQRSSCRRPPRQLNGLLPSREMPMKKGTKVLLLWDRELDDGTGTEYCWYRGEADSHTMSKGKVITYWVYHDNSPGAEEPLDFKYDGVFPLPHLIGLKFTLPYNYAYAITHICPSISPSMPSVTMGIRPYAHCQ